MTERAHFVTRNFFWQFATIATLAFFALGILILGSLSPTLEGYLIRQQKADTVVFANRIAAKLFTSDDFRSPLSDDRRDAFRKFVEQLTLPAPVVILFLDRSGTVIFSEPETYIGRTIPMTKEVNAVFRERVPTARFISLSVSEKEEFGIEEAFVQIAPFTFGESLEVVGALYSLSRTGLLRRSVDEAERDMILRVFPIYLALYVGLLLVAWFATRIMNRQRLALEEYTAGLEEKVRERTLEIEELNKREFERIDRFFSLVAHELRTPIVPARLFLQMLRAGKFGQLNEKQLDAVDTVYRSEERLCILINDILDVARSRANRLRIFPQNVSLKKLIEDVANDKRGQASEKKVQIFTTVGELPDIVIDPARVTQVLVNLLDNSLKFTEAHGTIRVDVEREGDEIVVHVSDTGIGLSKENLAKIFTPFFQTEKGLTRTHEGTGLGLVVCKGIIEAHSGRIWAESEGEGKGSRFTFTLPVHAPPPLPSPEAAPQAGNSQ